MNRFFQRIVGLAVIVIVLAASALLWWAVTAEHPSQVWDPVRASIGGVWDVMYSAEVPQIGLLAVALALALIMIVIVVAAERIVARRYRRTPPHRTSRSLSPRTVMARTRGEFAGQVTVSADPGAQRGGLAAGHHRLAAGADAAAGAHRRGGRQLHRRHRAGGA